MQGKISGFVLKPAETDIGCDQLCAKRCFTCLSNKRPEKRDCTTAMLIANGFDPERIAHPLPSLKTEH